MLDLSSLEALCAQRSETRSRLEKAIAVWNATGKRPTVSVAKSYYADMQAELSSRNAAANSTPPGRIGCHWNMPITC
jgi:hypothetical protein